MIRVGPRPLQPRGAWAENDGAAGTGLLAIFGSIKRGTPWENELGENL